MRVLAISAVLAVSLGATSPALAGDMLYRHADNGPDLLEQSAGRAYWVMLSECAGFYGAMSNAAPEPVRSEAYLARGVELLRLASGQVQVDRGVSTEEANALVSPYVSRARDLGEAGLARDPLETSVRNLTPTMVMTSTCDALTRAYSEAQGV